MTSIADPRRVSVVINTYNRAASLHNTLLAMPRQNYSDFEVIVVNGPSTDHTAEVLKHHAANIRVGACSERNLSISRNVGIEMARGDFVAFIDDDAVPDEDWLRSSRRNQSHRPERRRFRNRDRRSAPLRGGGPPDRQDCPHGLNHPNGD